MLEQRQQTSVAAEDQWVIFGINACALATCTGRKSQIARISVVIFPPTQPPAPLESAPLRIICIYKDNSISVLM